MKLTRYIITPFLIIFFLNHHICLYGQDIDVSMIHNYPLSLYGGNPQNWCIAEDHRGVMYFANQDGFVLEYDGSEWRKINVPELTSVRSLEVDSLGRIYVGTIDDFGYLAPDKQGNMEYVSFIHLLDSANRHFGEIWSISINKNEIFFQAWEKLFRLKNNKIETWHLPELYHRGFVVNNKYYVRQKWSGITVLNKDSFELINGGGQFAEETISAMLPFSENKILIGTRTKGLFIYDPDNPEKPIYKFDNKADKFLAENKLYHGIPLGKDKFMFATLQKGIIIINREGDILKEVNRSHSLLSDGAYFLHNQNEEIIWAGTENGISKLLINSPFQFLGEGIGSAINDIARFDRKLYLATDQGVVYLDSTDNISVKHVHKVNGISGMGWHFSKVQLPISKNGNNFTNKLLLASANGVYEIDNSRAILIKELKTVFSIHIAKKDPTIFFAGFKDGVFLFKWDYKTKSWTSSLAISDINLEIRYINEDSNNDIWITAMYNGVYRLSPAKIISKANKYVPDYSCTTPYKLDHFTTENGLPSNKGIICSSFQGDLVFLTNNGLFKYNKSSNKFTPDSSIHPMLAKESLSVFRFSEDFYGNVWIDSDIILIKQADNSFEVDTLSLKKISSARVDAVYPEKDGITWFGGDGLYRYDSKIKLNHNKEYPALIRKVSLNKDSVIFGGTNFNTSKYVCIEQPDELKPIIDHQFNSLSFEYTAIFFEDEKSLEYSYMLEGFDKKWSQWGNERKKEYTNLFEGDYTFKVKAKNFYDIESTVACYSFKILPPLYRTVWAYILYLFIFVFIIYLAIRINSKRLKTINTRLEKQVKERTKEILLQKNEIELQSAELAKLSIVASETDNAITIMDAKGDFQWFNNAYAKLFGYTFDEFVKEKGKNIRDVSSYMNIEDVITNCIENKKSAIYETHGATKTGKKVWTQTTISPILDDKGNVIKLISIEANIEKIKEFEKELIQKTQEISAQRDALAEVNATKDKFFAIISHDLKSPFNAILGFSELLSENFRSITVDKGELYSKQIFASSKQAFNLVENLLQWSRNKTGKIKINPELINLKEVVQENISLLILTTEKKNIKLTSGIPEDTTVYADSNLISIVLRNLLSNAIKFSNQGGSIKVLSSVKNGYIEVSVKDTGVGMSEDEKAKLFREDIHFTKKGTEEEKGTGLGLLICKEFVEKSGGKIWVDSKQGEGTSFYFTVPRYNNLTNV